MLRWVSIALLTTASVMASAAGAGTARQAASPVTVVSVIDGDTLTVSGGVRIRLLQIDAPEVGGGECYSQASRKALLRLAPIGSTVTLEADPALDQEDRYGRLLRYVKRDGINLNIRLVLDGAAAPYFYDGERGRYAARLIAAATRAMTSEVGVWAACPKAALTLTGPLQTGGGTTRATAPSTAPLPVASPPAASDPGPERCHPSYQGACLDPDASDYDCDGGSGNGPLYTGRVQVVGPDVFRLDADGDGIGCD